MKQVIYDKAGRILVKEVPSPEIGDDEILIKNAYSVISAGTEKSMVSLMKKPLWKMALQRPDLTGQVLKFAKESGVKKTMDLVKSRLDVWHLLGYSCAGKISRVGKNVQGFGKGDRVAAIGSGFANHAEYVAVPKTLAVKVPKGVSTKDAAYTGVACIGLQSLGQLKPQLGETIVVVGLGMIGQMVAQMLRANGCRVIGIDIDKSKTQKDYIDNGITKNSVKGVLKVTGGVGADGVIIAASSKVNLVNDAFDMCRKKGRVVLLGVCELDIDREKMFAKELEFKISTGFGAGTLDVMYEQMGRDYPIAYVRWTSSRNMDAVLDLVATKKLSYDEPKVYDIKKAAQAYKDLEYGQTTVLLKYEPSVELQTINITKTKKAKINIAIVGAGQFVKGFILPTLAKEKNVSLHAIITKNGPNARKLAKDYKARLASTSYKDILRDNNVELVVIGTRHDTHARIAIDALNAGKHVFCEKPMAINEKEFAALVRAIRKKDKLYTCGFNRRYSPAMSTIKNALDNGPIMANYVFNNTFLPKEHWVNIPCVGGGRILGEACHIMDVFGFLTESVPISLHAQSLATTTEQANDENNVIVVLKYEDGSVCTLTYCCTGNQNVQRERLTIFQNKVIEMNGFGSVKLNGKSIYSGKGDEGHTQEIKELIKAVSGKKNILATAEDCITATRATFSIIKAVR